MNVYFSGIGGVGLGPLAEIALDAGYTVTGSDLETGLMTDRVQSRGISVNIGQDGSFLRVAHSSQPFDWFVYSSAISPTHPELVLAKQLGIRTSKRDELLAHIIQEKRLKLIAVSGTHGKTTATGMFIWTLQQLGVPISYSIGATIDFGPSGHFDPDSEYFVYECDEFDRNFLHFSPYLSIVTSLDYDHPDTYPTEADYLAAFTQFASQSLQVIAWNDQHPEVFEQLYQASLLDPSQINQNISVIGLHNRRNATLVQTAIKRLGFNQDTDGILSNFPGTDRRFEKLADNLYSDYGHHPVEIAATLQLAHEISPHIVLVYQPHQNIRQHEIRDSYTDQFELAEDIYWLPTYLSREDPTLAVLKPEELIQHITNKERVHVADFNDQLWALIQKARDDGKLVLGMGAGAIDGWLREKLTH
ncbi:MAG: Mur ligase domain-containing protein [Candidatus Saccharibacteria bacterium]